MLDNLIKTKEVQSLLMQIFNNPKYYDKTIEEVLESQFVLQERILLLFYDTLFKYQMLITDHKYLKEFMLSFETLLKRLDNVDDINYGVSKIIGKTILKKLGITPEEKEEKKEFVLKYVYEVYIKNGFYIKGLSRVDYYNIRGKSLNKNIFLPEVQELNEILSRYDFNILESQNNNITFNTDIIKACMESINSPIYLYDLVVNNSFISKNKDAYYLKDLQLCLDNLSIVLKELNVNDKDKKRIIKLFKKIWPFYNTESNNIYLIFIKRSKLNSIIEYKENFDFDFDEALYNLFNTYNDFYVTDNINEKIDFSCELPSYYQYKIRKNKKNKVKRIEFIDDGFNFNNKYGKATLFILIGSLLIIIGVVFTIIFNL